MAFKLTKARGHPLYGLEVTDEDGVPYLTHTKRSVLKAGAVLFIHHEATPCPYQVAFSFAGQEDMPDDWHTVPGTDDPATLALAIQWEYSEFEYQDGWKDIPLG